MKKIGLTLAAAILGFVAFSTSGPSVASAQPGEELACKPTGSKCNNSFECCSQNCQTVNNKTTCH